MQKNKLNNVIVLKEVSSNIVEEAIVVLKPNVNFKQHEKSLNNTLKDNKKYTVLKEAEYVIEQYIFQMQIKNKEFEKDKIEKRYRLLKKVTTALIILNIFLLLKLF